jgi:serine/threonine protein kinase
VSKAGAANYASPEMTCGLEYGPRVDVWGIGASIAATMCGMSFDLLFDHKSIAVVDRSAVTFSGSGWIVNLRGYLAPVAADFVESACAVSPNQRPMIGQLLDHPFFYDQGQGIVI